MAAEGEAGVGGVVVWNKGFGNHDKKKPRSGKEG